MSTAEQDMERVEAAEELSRPQHAAATVSAIQMFRFSRYVHVGPGAADCEESESGACADPLHFHAWVRLPNKFQHKDIRDKGLAAKARKIRALRDAESDSFVVLEAEIEEIRALGDDKLLIDELMSADWSADYLSAIGDVNEDEKWEHIDQDREEYDRLYQVEDAKPEEERSDAFKELERHLTDYRDAIHARLDELQQPKRQGLLEKGHDALVDMVKDQRVGREGDRAFLQTYNEWTWFTGTMKPIKHSVTQQPFEPAFTSMDHMKAAAPEVIDALSEAFAELEAEIQQGSSGNS